MCVSWTMFANSILYRWLPLVQLWAPVGNLWVPLGSLWTFFGSLWLPLACIGLSLAPFGEPLGHICNLIENWTSFTEKFVKFKTVNKKQLFGIRPWSQRKWCQQVLFRPSLPHMPWVRMTGVKQTPSNYIHGLPSQYIQVDIRFL